MLYIYIITKLLLFHCNTFEAKYKNLLNLAFLNLYSSFWLVITYLIVSICYDLEKKTLFFV